MFLILYGHTYVKNVCLLFTVKQQINTTWKGDRQDVDFLSEIAEVGLLDKQVRLEKFCMSSICGSMKKVTVVAYGKCLMDSFRWPYRVLLNSQLESVHDYFPWLVEHLQDILSHK